MKTMQGAVNWFEIPATDISRAKTFYESIFDIEMTGLNPVEGLRMALFPVEPDTVGGALAEYSEFYHPGNQGPVVYLNANPDLQSVLDRIPDAGGKVIMPKTPISDEHGFMAVFEDSEGNRVALHSVS